MKYLLFVAAEVSGIVENAMNEARIQWWMVGGNGNQYGYRFVTAVDRARAYEAILGALLKTVTFGETIG